MDLETVDLKWRGLSRDSPGGAETWDGRSEEMDRRPLPEFGKDAFLGLLETTAGLGPETTALDIGCGTGRYSIPLAGRIGRVVGVDFSRGMIETARRRAVREGAENAMFEVCDWADEACAYDTGDGFDIVFARMTPAVSKVPSLQRMIRACNRMCYLTMHLEIENGLHRTLDGILGIAPPDSYARPSVILNALWCMGYDPRLGYETLVYDYVQTPEEALTRYRGGPLRSLELTDAQTAAAEEHLRSAAVDGYLTGTSVSRVLTIYWDVSDKQL